MKKFLALLMAAMMCLLLCACSSSGDKDDSKKDDDSSVVGSDSKQEETNEEKKDENKPIDFTVDGGTIKYVGVEKANDGLCDEDDVIVIKFAFTSNMDVPSQCQRVFGIKFYQNGVQLDKSLSYSSKGGDQYDLVGDYFSEVMKGGTVTFGRLVQVGDYSPVTIMVNEWGKNDNYQMMELDLGVLNGEASSDDAPAGKDEPQATQPAETPTEPAEKEDAVKTIAIGDKIETEKFDFTLNKVEITYELKPKNTSGVYMSYTAEDGKVYVHIDGTYYNKAKKDACIRDLFLPTADYDNGYTYDGFVVVDDGDNNFDWVSSYVAATPLESCHYHGLIECPEVIDESDAPLFVTFKIDGTTYRYDIR